MIIKVLKKKFITQFQVFKSENERIFSSIQFLNPFAYLRDKRKVFKNILLT